MVDISGAASALFEARRTLDPIGPVRDTYAVATPVEAYEVQEENTRRYLADGRVLVGRKIGLTSVAVQQQLGVDEPDFGMLWGDSGYQPGDDIPISGFMQPKVEVEIAFRMGRDVSDPDITIPDLSAAVDSVFAAVEIVDSAVANWDIRLVDTIADNASGGGYVIGNDPHRLGEFDLRLCGMALSRGGSDVSLGVGAACLGTPLNAVQWLARKMIAVGRPLKTGDLVLSGALGPMVAVEGGDRFDVSIAGFSPFSIFFSR